MRVSPSSTEITSQSAIDHILRVNPKRIRWLAFADPMDRLNQRQKDLANLAKSHKIPIEFGHRIEKNSEGILAHLLPFEYLELKPFLQQDKLKTKSILLVLDHLQDPQNFGALIRSAEAFGASAIIIPKDRSAQVTPGVYHASVGAVESIPIIQVSNVAETLKRLKEYNYWIVGTALNGNAKALKDTPTFERVAIVLGSELEGLSKIVEGTCDWLTFIPMAGKIDSLNVSAAGAVLLYFFSNR